MKDNFELAGLCIFCYTPQVRIFYQLLANTVISTITTMTVWFAIIFYTYLQTKSVFATAIMSGIYMGTTALTGFWFGNLVDKYAKKKVMLASSAISLVLFIASFLIYLTVDHALFSQITSPQLWMLIVVLLLGVLVSNVRSIAMTTLTTVLVPEDRRDKVNGLVGTAFGISFLITSVISGILVGHSGMMLVLIGAIALMAITLVHLWLLPIPENRSQAAALGQAVKLDISGTIAAISKTPGLFPLIFFTMFNNFLGGVFMSMMDAYGLSLVSVQVWGFLWGFLSTAFIIGGLAIAKFGLGKNPLNSLFMANIVIWSICCVFTLQPSILLLAVGAFIYLCVVPYIEASEHTIIQKVVPQERQGRVFGFAQSIEQAASPMMSFAIGPIAQFIFIPFMTTGSGVELIGGWFGTGPDRGMALVFTLAGVIGLIASILARNSKYYRLLSERYLQM